MISKLPIANTLTALTLPPQAPANDIILAIYLSFQAGVCWCKNKSVIGPPILWAIIVHGISPFALYVSSISVLKSTNHC